jgi:hypothetical protein
MSVAKDDQAACKLALARGKKALVRVGGGEKFNDVANSVWAYKDNATSYAKYMMLHGVGTVGAAGGWVSCLFVFSVSIPSYGEVYQQSTNECYYHFCSYHAAAPRRRVRMGSGTSMGTWC